MCNLYKSFVIFYSQLLILCNRIKFCAHKRLCKAVLVCLGNLPNFGFLRSRSEILLVQTLYFSDITYFQRRTSTKSSHDFVYNSQKFVLPLNFTAFCAIIYQAFTRLFS